MLKSICIFISLIVGFQSGSDDCLLLIDKLFIKRPGSYLAIPGDKDGRKFIVDSYSLHKYYVEHKTTVKAIDFKGYLKQTIEKGVNFKANDLNKNLNEFPVYVINGDLDVFKEYEAKGIEFIKKKYFKKLGDQDYRAKLTSDDILHGLIYIMAQNQYIIGFSGYNGSYVFRDKAIILAKAKKDNRL